MAYTAPGVYIRDIQSGSQSIAQLSPSVGALIGITRSGVTNTPVRVNSWTEYLNNFANGLNTPFIQNDYLSYSVYGFFNNGGRELYVVNVKKNGVKAQAKTNTTGITATAKTEGTWGNSLSIVFTQSKSYTELNKVFDFKLTLEDDEVEIKEIPLASINTSVMENSTVSARLSAFAFTSTALITEPVNGEVVTFEGGSDGDVLIDTDYIDALSTLDAVDDITLIAIPGQTSSAINSGLIAYCEEHDLFPLLDFPTGTTVSNAKTTRLATTGRTGAICYPWGKVLDPLTNTLKAVPTCGHVMGVYARTIANRGIHKAPAGVDAVVRGFVEMDTKLTPGDVSLLNPCGVVCIQSRPNAGIVIWGARSINSSDTTMKYVTDGLLNLNIKRSLYVGTQFAVFEPNDESLWSRVQATCKAFLETLRSEGALKGTSDEAYYVTVDSSNNSNDSIARGELNIEIGYAPVKPAEFVIIKLAHSIEA